MTTTGKEIMKEFNGTELLELYINKHQVEDYQMLRGFLKDPEIKPGDKIEVLKLLWKYTMKEPARQTEVSGLSGEPLTINLVKYADNNSV